MMSILYLSVVSYPFAIRYLSSCDPILYLSFLGVQIWPMCSIQTCHGQGSYFGDYVRGIIFYYRRLSSIIIHFIKGQSKAKPHSFTNISKLIPELYNFRITLRICSQTDSITDFVLQIHSLDGIQSAKTENKFSDGRSILQDAMPL